MAAKAVIRFAILAAVTIAAVPALAQTSDSNAGRTKTDCSDTTGAATAD
jgi:hypothetical protein